MRFNSFLNEQRFKWTKELPTKPGWYWIKNTSDGRTFIKYFDGKNIDAGLRDVSIEKYNGEKGGPEGEPRLWAGPIPEPR